jgi:HSP20 family protein
MALTRREETTWDPFRELRDMANRLNRVFGFEGQNAGLAREGQALAGIDWAPSVNISETNDAYVLRADLPEVKKEDVKVSAESGTLTIEGERRQQKQQDDERYHLVESSYGRFMRRFTLPDAADADKIDASFKDGALSVRIPKSASKPPSARQIKVN